MINETQLLFATDLVETLIRRFLPAVVCAAAITLPCAQAAAQKAASTPAGDVVQRALNILGGEDILQRTRTIHTTEKRLTFHIQEATN
jgi:hypothetical protein